MTVLGRPSLRRRFGWRAFLITLAIVEVITLGSAYFWQGRLMDATRESLSDHIASLTSSIELDREAGFDPFTAGELVVLPQPETGVQILAADGSIVATSSQLIGREVFIPFSDLSPGRYREIEVESPDFGHSLVIATVVGSGDDAYGVEAITSLASVDSAFRLMFVGVPLLGLLLAAIVGLVVAAAVRAALLPVRRLSERAAAISDAGMPEPLNVSADSMELEELSSHLDRLLERIRSSFMREQRFLDDASHELRTPIAIARTELELARRAASDPETEAALDSALDELSRLDQLAADLLVLARERAAGTDGYAIVDVAAVARRAAGTVLRDPRQRTVHIEVDGSGEVLGDADALERALRNLVANAARACRDLVRIDVDSVGDAVLVEVGDDGPGIPPHLLDSLFDRFARGRGETAHSTGLGTAIAAEVVAHHGGTITADNPEDGGALVTMRFPAASGVTRSRYDDHRNG